MIELPRAAPIYVAGHRGLVGSAIVRRLRAEGFDNLLLATRAEIDLRDQRAVHAWFDRERPQVVFMAAGTVGGINANSTRPAEFIYDNLIMHTTVVHASYLTGVRRLLYLGSACIYPRLAPQPIPEEALLTGLLEPTNESYAVAKISGIALCQAYRRQYGCDFISVMPTNLYGPGDNFDATGSHVVPALIRRFHEAKMQGLTEVVVWGSGIPRRELLHVDDLADACLFLMRNYAGERHLNVGTGEDQSIRDLAELIRDIVSPGVALVFDRSRPDGAPRRLLDVSRLHALGWRHRRGLAEGISETYAWFLAHHAEARGIAVASS